MSLNLRVVIPVGGAVIFAGIAGFLYYKLRNDDEESDDRKPNQLPVIPSQVEIKVPIHAVGAIIGRHGANIKHITQLTSTAINFNDLGENERICVIKGNPQKVEKAKELILQAIADIAIIEKLDINIPDYAVGKVIGRGGDSIRNIQRISGAKVKICDSDDRGTDAKEDDISMDSVRRISIKGTKEQVAIAQYNILQKVEEEEKMRAKIKSSASNRSHRSKQTRQENGFKEGNSDPVFESQTPLPLASMANKNYGEVFVSAVHNAAHFWVQVVGPKTVELDQMVSEMTEFYEDVTNKNLYMPSKVNVGDIVAAKFPMDDMWYRGRVCPPESSNGPDVHTIYFVDFGDTSEVHFDALCELRTDFLRLGFQAIECYLANVDPASAETEEAIQMFESLTHACHWKPIMLKVLGYKEEERETIPCVSVVDTEGQEDVDIAKILLEKGLVTPLETVETTTTNETTSS